MTKETKRQNIDADCPFCGVKPQNYNGNLYCPNPKCFIHLLTTTPEKWNYRPNEQALAHKFKLAQNIIREMLGEC